MPVTFGTVQLVPAPAAPAAGSGAPGPAAAAAPPPPDPKDLAPALAKLHDRAARVRAH